MVRDHFSKIRYNTMPATAMFMIDGALCVGDMKWWHALVGRYLSSQPLRLLLKAFRTERERVRHRLSAKGKHRDVRMNSCLDQFCTSHRNSHWRSTVQHQLVSSFPFSLVFDGRDVEAEKMYLKKAYNRFRNIKDKKIANAAAPTEKKIAKKKIANKKTATEKRMFEIQSEGEMSCDGEVVRVVKMDMDASGALQKVTIYFEDLDRYNVIYSNLKAFRDFLQLLSSEAYYCEKQKNINETGVRVWSLRRLLKSSTLKSSTRKRPRSYSICHVVWL